MIKKNDIILIVSILLIVMAVFLVIALTREDGAYVVVKVNGQEVGKYSLDEDGEYELNGGTNILRIEGGKAYLTDADCPDHLCIKQGKIDHTGETITCLPNKLTVTVYGSDGDVELVN